MKTIQSYINALSSAEIAQAVEEVQNWERSSVLCEGIIKKVSEQLNKAFHLDTAHSRRLVKEGVIARAAMEYVKIMKWKTQFVPSKQYLKKDGRVVIDITDNEFEAIMEAKSSYETMADFFKEKHDVKAEKETKQNVKALTRIIQKYNEGITAILMRREKMCPYGKEAKAQCTPLRAQDCPHSDVCGKTRRRRK